MADTLRTPTHRLLAGPDGRAIADLVFVDRAQARTQYRTCVRRGGRQPVRTCFTTTSGDVGMPTITPLRFQRGPYRVAWSVAGVVVARWQFAVV